MTVQISFVSDMLGNRLLVLSCEGSNVNIYKTIVKDNLTFRTDSEMLTRTVLFLSSCIFNILGSFFRISETDTLNS